ncbi:hypothetical protein BJ138DRAFT_1010835 [Hygrophoropsis aurantiaca]|uniref:Uncharacterized protein n=1 Tax=Hygrophoropsis aurantiaca TaxID=72124 RepID=A0ACB8A8L0_9AGAM|nr:hypothetical protein BJ138DRAFT_1010835 [Hygrophoropsis aurantiaca]
MEHILTDCEQGPQKLLWKLTRNLWPHSEHPWNHPSIGAILGCGSIKNLKPTTITQNSQRDQPNKSPKKRDGKARLLSILLGETAYLIWVIRCEIVIQGKEFTNKDLTTRWYNMINNRIQTDRLLAKNRNYRKLNADIVQSTWRKTLKNEQSLQPDWVTDPEVLVGINSPEPSS